MSIVPQSNCETCPMHAQLAQMGVSMGNYDFLVALAGNPNTGKSSVFNALTGLRQHVGNWTGKTVKRAEGGYRDGAFDGAFKLFHPSGGVKEIGAYRAGKAHGRFVRWDEAGNVAKEAVFEDGRKVSQ